MDREKVITEIEDALSGNLAKVGHVYRMSLNGLKDKALKDALVMLKEYKRQDGCPCTHCMEWECDEVCEEYKKWKDT